VSHALSLIGRIVDVTVVALIFVAFF